jgi:hypothetical protein
MTVSSVVKAVAVFLLLASPVFAAENNVQLSVAQAGPREVEEQTQKAIVRDYNAAWRSLAAALEQNSPASLGDLWVGFAREKLVKAIAAQNRSGVRVRSLDRGHRLEAVYYSAEGSALELHDTAQIEQQLLDGNSVIHTEEVTAHYVVVMTPAADHWQVRILQAER